MTIGMTCIMLPAFFSSAVAVPSYRSGLKLGDSAFYDLSGTYGFSPGKPVTQMSVRAVAVTNITASFSGFYPDGLSSANVYWIDVFTGQIRNASSNLFFAVTPGLLVADPIFNGQNVKITSQQTTQCGGATRQMVSVQFTRSYQNVAVGWDQSTGALCRLNLSDLNNQVRSLSMSMKNTTLWGPDSGTFDPFSPLVIAANVSAAVGLPLLALVLFVYFRRVRVRRKGRSK
jgi:hypothetical protein